MIYKDQVSERFIVWEFKRRVRKKGFFFTDPPKRVFRTSSKMEGFGGLTSEFTYECLLKF